MHTALILALLIPLALAQQQQPDYEYADEDFVGPTYTFTCPETNGLFASEEQCDLYFLCEKGEYKPVLCDDGLVFDDSSRNRERCVLPQNVECGTRKLRQSPTKDIDVRCPRANGFYDHPSPKECSKFISCDKGRAFEMSCAASLIFDIKIGGCVHKNQRSSQAKVCETVEEEELPEIDGFRCPGSTALGPTGLLTQHPVFGHPSDCQFFFTCYFGREPHKFGCPEGQVFDTVAQVCKESAEVPECSCWYGCGEDSKCPETCNADCSCPRPEELEFLDVE